MTNFHETFHPDYVDAQPDWVTMRDTNVGQRQIKRKRELYLPTTSGMRALGMGTGQEGLQQYEAYLCRAVFPQLVAPAIERLVGIMHRKLAKIELPTALEPMRNNATDKGESLDLLLRKINQEQLLAGRYGLLVDVPTGGSDVIPYLSTYDAETIINWDEVRDPTSRLKLNFLVLDESDDTRSDFTWEFLKKFRILRLNEQGQYQVDVVEFTEKSLTTAQRESGFPMNPDDLIIPNISGRPLNFIPFTFIGSRDLTSDPDKIPLLGLAELSLTIYRGEADYRQTLFMQGQDTLVIIGQNAPQPLGDKADVKPTVVGAGGKLNVPTGGDAKYIGVNSSGLSEQRQSLENDRNRADEASGILMVSVGSDRQSGEALHIRIAARTASLITIAKAGAAGLENALKHAAIWKGANPDEVKVTANLDFIENQFNGKDLVDLVSAKIQGLPIAWESIHQFAVDREITTRTFEEELEKIGQEDTDGVFGILTAQGATSPNPNENSGETI